MKICSLMYSFPNFEPVCCSMSVSNSCFLPCIQVSQETGKVVWYSHLFKNFLQFVVIHTVKGFSIVNEAEELFWNSLAFSMGLPGSSDGKESTCNAGDLGFVPGLGRLPGGVHGNRLHKWRQFDLWFLFTTPCVLTYKSTVIYMHPCNCFLISVPSGTSPATFAVCSLYCKIISSYFTVLFPPRSLSAGTKSNTAFSFQTSSHSEAVPWQPDELIHQS